MGNSQTTPRPLRCAIYTRKSHEEGLDQTFNSLDAQRQAGLDYIRSQQHEGWQAIDTHYDDGGFTGGNMERPALKHLLEDIERRKGGGIDVVVVYKVDRLSRSLGDFAQMMRVFDEHGVSFVSVTQQFNTTTSMGRLTLNMLLSFAQFEREVTGERIRDKIAATKKRGLWVGGQPPLGYGLEERKLHIVLPEAELVRAIFRGFLEVEGSLVELAGRLNEQGHTTKRWVSTRDKTHGGKPLTPKYLHRVLTNPLYRGQIVHKTKVWKGQHDAIVTKTLWDRVQAAIDTQQRQTQHRWDHPHLLKGKLRTHDDFAMSPSAVHRPAASTRPATGKREKRIVRYYVSQKAIQQGYKKCRIKTVNAKHLDDLVRSVVFNELEAESTEALCRCDHATRNYWVRQVVKRVVLGPDRLTVELDPVQLETLKDHEWTKPTNDEESPSYMPDACLYRPEVRHVRGGVVLELAIQLKRLDGKRLILASDGRDLTMPAQALPKPHLVEALGQAYAWRQLLMEHRFGIAELSKRLGVADARIHKLLGLTSLSPTIVRRVLTGQLPQHATLEHLLAAAAHPDWHQQATYLGLGREPESATAQAG